MRKMILAAAATLSLVSGSALAADLSYPTKAPAYVAPIQNYDWSGFYIGVMGGGGWGRSNQSDGAVATGFYDVSGGMIGGTIGYNIQTGPWVWGVEGDGAWTRIRGSVATGICAGGSCFTNLNWLATVRGRVGWAAGPIMPYITAGGAFGEVFAGQAGCAPGTCGSNTRAGWTAGAGLEWMFAQGWSAKFEYLYVDLGNYVQYTPAVPVSVSERVHTAKVGINYHFNWGGSAGPVVARY